MLNNFFNKMFIILYFSFYLSSTEIKLLKQIKKKSNINIKKNENNSYIFHKLKKSLIH